VTKILITEVMDRESVDSLAGQFDVTYDPDLHKTPQEIVELMRDADALIVKERTQVTRDLIIGAPRLRAVGRLGAGLDNIDVQACRERSIDVIVAAGANSTAVAEYVMCTMLLLARPGAYNASQEVRAGGWPQQAARKGREIEGKTLGILGFGNVGQRVASLAGGFGMKVLAWAPTKSPDDPVFAKHHTRHVELDDLLPRCDVVSINVPLTPQTRQLLNPARIATMKKGAILINTARGGIVDEAALAQALLNGNLSGAALDVFAQEPLGAGSPLADVPNLILSPHIAGGTVESVRRRGSLIADAIAAKLLARSHTP
jgi:(S)-sulfolactate dehydrogenase